MCKTVSCDFRDKRNTESYIYWKLKLLKKNFKYNES